MPRRAYSAAKTSLRQAGGLPGAQLLGCRTGSGGEFSGNANLTNANFFELVQTRHVLPYGADAIQLVYAGFAKTTASSFQEVAIAPAVWRVAQGTLTPAAGGTTYAVGDTVTGPTNSSPTTIVAPWIARVLAVSAGAITKLQLIRPGIYTGTGGPPADGMAQSATSGSGTGATFNAQWEGFAGAAHLSVLPIFPTSALTGPGALQLAAQGANYSDMTESWDLYFPAGDIFVSEPIPVDIPQGQAIGIKGEIIGANLQPGRPCITTEFCAVGSSFFERANSTSNPGSSQANQLVQPLGIIGIPKVVGPSVLIIGDSRLAYNGAGSDPMDSDGNWGWMERALASKMPFSSMVRSSDQLANYVANATPPGASQFGLKRTIQATRPSVCYVNLSINDFISGGQTAATVLSWEKQLVAFLRSLGIQIVVTDTCDPNTTSSNGWTDLPGQTISSGGAQAVLRNTNLRTGAYAGVYDFFIDNQGITEDNSTGSPSGKWIPNTTLDGMHQVQTALVAKAAHAGAIIFSALGVR